MADWLEKRLGSEGRTLTFSAAHWLSKQAMRRMETPGVFR